MKKTKRLVSLVLVLMLALSVCLVGCTPDVPSGGDETVLRMATGYNDERTGITMNSKVAGDGIVLADGNTYHSGDLKPTWAFLEEELGVKFEDKFPGKKASETYEGLKNQLDTVDMLSATAQQANEAGAQGKLVDLAQHLDKMPNFKAYLEENPIVRLSITGDVNKGSIYFSPYFDGSNDIERMPLMRVDLVEKLLNGTGEFTATASANLAPAKYEPYMPTTGKVEIDVVNKTTKAVEKVTKDYDKAGNIVAKMNEKLAQGEVTGAQAVNMLRTYIDQAYNNYYGENRADLFIGQNAAWDADEMVALLRCVVANAETLVDTPNAVDADSKPIKKIEGLFSREEAKLQRNVDLFRFAGTLFGVRGLESRSDYLYFNKEGELMDARNQEDTYIAMERMHAMKEEGLISKDYANSSADTAKSENYVKDSTGFMSYDYNQTQTVWNATVYAKDEAKKNYKYMAVMVPVARWMDGTSDTGVYMRFTESWRSVKTDAWAISKAGVEGNEAKLNAALKLIDYAYSIQGQITMSYGPDAFIDVKDADVVIKTKDDVAKKYNTFDFNGEQWPKISVDTFAELYDREKGNYTNYARRYLGSTLSFLKSQAFEFQCTSAVGKEGAGYISNAIKAGTIKHPKLAVEENMWYTSIPTVFPTTNNENNAINAYTNLLNDGKYSQSNGKTNVLVNLIAEGYSTTGEITDRATAIAKANEWGVQQVLDIKNEPKSKDNPTGGVVVRLLEFYNNLNK